MRTRFALALLSIPALLGACATTAPAEHEHSLSWVWILTGPRDAEVQGEARNAAFAGHFANMDRMAEEGQLLVAGPFGEPRAQDDHRGIFLLATADTAHAEEVAFSDPTAQAGVFVFEVEPFATDDPLDRLGPLHEAAIEASGVENPPPGYHARPYVLLTGAPAGAAEAALETAGAPVLFAGRLGAGEAERTLACLDAQTADEAQALLPAAGGVSWTVMPWFASNEVVNLR